MTLKENMGEDWFNILKPFLISKEYKEIGNKLTELLENNLTLFPEIDNIFAAFRECKYKDLHTIIIGIEPPTTTTYSGYVADGLAFSSGIYEFMPKELEIIYDKIDRQIYRNNTSGLYKTSSLKRWANQGILLLNCSLTSSIDRSASHIDIWRPFITYLLNYINSNRNNVAVILLGVNAYKYRNIFTNPDFGIFTCEHPTMSILDKRAWVSEDIFLLVNNYHKKRNNINIEW